MALAKTSASKEPHGGCCWVVDWCVLAVFQRVSIRELGWSQEHPTAMAGMLPKFPLQRRSAPAPRAAQDLASSSLALLLPLAFLTLCLQFPALSFSWRQEHPAPFRESLCNESFALIWAGFSQMLQSWEGLHRAQVCHGNVALIW